MRDKLEWLWTVTVAAVLTVGLSMLIVVAYWINASMSDMNGAVPPAQRGMHAASAAVIALIAVGGPPYVMAVLRTAPSLRRRR